MTVDFVVVGGGVAGSVFSWLMGRRGFSVRVYDMGGRYFKPCGEVVPAGLLNFLEERGIPQPSVLNRIRVFEFIVEGRSLVYEFDYPVWVSIEKAEWVERLREESGAGLHVGAVEPCRVRSEAGRLVVDARGPFASRGRRIVVWRAYARRPFPGSERVVVVLSFDPLGLAWVFPHGDEANIGGGFVGVADPREPSLGLLRTAGLEPGGLRGEAYSLVTLWPRVRRVTCSRVLTVGEAAGFVQSLGGEGIRPAVLSAVAAADAASEAEEFWDIVSIYEAMTARLGAEARLSAVLLSAAPIAWRMVVGGEAAPFVEAWLRGELGETRKILGMLVRALARPHSTRPRAAASNERSLDLTSPTFS